MATVNVTGQGFGTSSWANAWAQSPNQTYDPSWPGAIDTSVHDSDENHGTQVGPVHSPAGQVAGNDYVQSLDLGMEDISGWAPNESYGNHDVPVPAWSSNANSRASDVHARGDGYYAFTPRPMFGTPSTSTQDNQSAATAFSWDAVTGRQNKQPEERTAVDFNYAGLHDSGYDVAPRFFENQHPALYVNIADVPAPVTPYDGGSSGLLPDSRFRKILTENYNPPADPNVLVTQPQQPSGNDFGEVW